MNQGTIFAMSMLPPLPLAPRAWEKAKAKVIGMIMSVRVSLTTVAKRPTASLKEKAAATTEEISFITVPAHNPNAFSDIFIRCPKAGKRNTAMISKRKIVDMARLSVEDHIKNKILLRGTIA